MNIDTTTLQCFLALAETSNFTKAAQQVGRTQSAVSQQIAKLESMLEKPLFVRGKNFSLTNEGEIFLGYARQIFSLHREVIDRFREPDLEGEVKFGIPEDFASVYLSDILVDFSRIHPRIFLNVECDLTLNLFEKFKRGEFDLVLLKMNRPNDFSNGLDVCSEQLEWVGHPNLIAQQKNVPIPLVLSPTPCVYRSRAIKALDKAKIKWRLVFSSPSYAGTIAAVKAGLGITVLPRTMIPEQLEALNFSYLPKLNDTHICLLKHDNSNRALLSFEKFVFEKLTR
ncbi:MAG: LysR substrate-binding domain-containing protein [Coxiellaceae bacterium]|nr:LysR substrate-binding domain-containing protein [Coxiellaceae bacterium]